MSLLTKLKNSLPVISDYPSIPVKIAPLLIGLSFSSITNADAFYNDYSSDEIKDKISTLVETRGKYAEVFVREQYGCKTGELRKEIGGFMREVIVKGQKLKHTDDSFVDDVNVLTNKNNSGQCGPTLSQQTKMGADKNDEKNDGRVRVRETMSSSKDKTRTSVEIDNFFKKEYSQREIKQTMTPKKIMRKKL